MKNDGYEGRQHAQRIATDADQTEFTAFKEGSAIIESGLYDDRIADAMDDFDVTHPEGGPRWVAEDLKLDSAVGELQSELERRVGVLGGSYPFELDGNSIKYQPKVGEGEARLYEFFLCLCNTKSLTTGRFAELPRVFERVSAQLAAAFFGNHTKHIHVGAPRDTEVGKSFADAMQYVGRVTGEWMWNPENTLPNSKIHGDEGCDFIVWSDPPDGRKVGQLFILGQCACGNNWEDKFGDLSIDKIRRWFHPMTSVRPVRTFATPFHVTDAKLSEASVDAGYLFDRARLCAIGKRSGAQVISSKYKCDIERLIKLVLDD